MAIQPDAQPKGNREYATETIIEALHEAKGMITVAADLIGCSPSTVHRRARQEERIAKVIWEERNKIDDVAELKLFEAIQNGEAWAIRFRLEQGGGRDYKQRAEVQHESDGDEQNSEIKRTLTGQSFAPEPDDDEVIDVEAEEQKQLEGEGSGDD